MLQSQSPWWNQILLAFSNVEQGSGREDVPSSSCFLFSFVFSVFYLFIFFGGTYLLFLLLVSSSSDGTEEHGSRIGSNRPISSFFEDELFDQIGAQCQGGLLSKLDCSANKLKK